VKFLVPCFKAVAVSEASPDLSLSLMAPGGADTLMTGVMLLHQENGPFGLKVV
jgi:hypothetical protein